MLFSCQGECQTFHWEYFNEWGEDYKKDSSYEEYESGDDYVKDEKKEDKKSDDSYDKEEKSSDYKEPEKKDTKYEEKPSKAEDKYEEKKEHKSEKTYGKQHKSVYKRKKYGKADKVRRVCARRVIGPCVTHWVAAGGADIP